MSPNSTLIPARHGTAVKMERGQKLKLINTHGTQVIDTFAFCAHDTTEYLSMQHTRRANLKINPASGDVLYSSHRNPMLTITEDTTGAAHDTLIPACDPASEGHLDNCLENMHTALKGLDITVSLCPQPLNLFLRVTMDLGGNLSIKAPGSRPGDFVVLRAETDIIVVLSACPQDLDDVNGGTPTDVQYELY